MSMCIRSEYCVIFAIMQGKTSMLDRERQITRKEIAQTDKCCEHWVYSLLTNLMPTCTFYCISFAVYMALFSIAYICGAHILAPFFREQNKNAVDFSVTDTAKRFHQIRKAFCFCRSLQSTKWSKLHCVYAIHAAETQKIHDIKSEKNKKKTVAFLCYCASICWLHFSIEHKHFSRFFRFLFYIRCLVPCLSHSNHRSIAVIFISVYAAANKSQTRICAAAF